jgi:GTP-binding protein YchF
MKKIALCGLPNSGKSTFIKLISQSDVLIASYPFSTLKAQEYAVFVFSQELKNLFEITKSKKLIPPHLIFIDVPGLIKGAHKGEGLGNEFLSYLRGSDFILEIIRNFEKEDVPHVEGKVDIIRDVLIIEDEIIYSEKEILERLIKKIEKEKDKGLKEKGKILESVYNQLSPGKRFPEFYDLVKEFNLLIIKKWFLLINGKEVETEKLKNDLMDLCEIELSKNFAFEKIYSLDFLKEIENLKMNFTENNYGFYNFLNSLRKDLGLIQFFTFNKEITQGWFIPEGSSLFEAAKMIHNELALKFKVAECIDLNSFLQIGDWEKAKKMGLIRNEGKDSKVEENKIIYVKI